MGSLQSSPHAPTLPMSLGGCAVQGTPRIAQRGGGEGDGSVWQTKMLVPMQQSEERDVEFLPENLNASYHKYTYKNKKKIEQAFCVHTQASHTLLPR